MYTIIPLVVAAALFGYGVYVQSTTSPDQDVGQLQQRQFAQNPTPTPSVTSTLFAESSQPDPTPEPADDRLIQFPGATIVHQSDAQWRLTTTTDARSVFDWYQQELTVQGFQIRTTVRTSTNDAFAGVLQAQTPRYVSVTIQRDAGESTTIQFDIRQ